MRETQRPIIRLIAGGGGSSEPYTQPLAGGAALDQAREAVLTIALATSCPAARRVLRESAAELHLQAHAARVASRAQLL